MVSNKHTHTAINTNTNTNTNSHKQPPENTTSKSQKAQAHSHGHQHKHNCHLKSTNDYQNHQICHLQSPTNLTENSLSLSSLSDSINLDLNFLFSLRLSPLQPKKSHNQYPNHHKLPIDTQAKNWVVAVREVAPRPRHTPQFIQKRAKLLPLFKPINNA